MSVGALAEPPSGDARASAELGPQKSKVAQAPSLGEHKLENLQALRGIAILLVLVYHLWRYEDWHLGGHTLLPSLAFGGRAGVDLFFVISGFIMTTITLGKFQQKDGTKKFLLRRVARIYPLYWCFTLLYLPMLFMSPQLMKRHTGAQGVDVARSFLLLPQTNAPLVGQAWTLIYEIFFYLIFSLLLLRPEKEKRRLLLAWAGLVLAGKLALDGTHLLEASPFLRLITDPMNLEFLAGCLVALAVQHGFRQLPLTAIAGAVLLGALTLLASEEWHRAFLYLVPMALLVYGVVVLEQNGGRLLPRPLRYIGDISYSMYLSHTLALSIALKAVGFLKLKSGVLAHGVFLLTGPCLALIAAALCYRWLERPLLQCCYAFIPRILSRPPGMSRLPRAV